MKQTLVSFIIPVLNGEKDISRCLRSVWNLDFPRDQCEIIVLDNGSTDRTQEIVRNLGFTFYILPRMSLGALRNRGVAIAHGHYVAFVDADVELKPCWLDAGLKAFQDPQVVAAGCFPRAPQPATWVQQTWEIHQRGTQNQHSRRPVSWLPSMNLLVRRKIFLTIAGFNEQLVTAEDVDLCYRLGHHGTILCVPTMDAIHWGEAADLRSFWRKELWRGSGNLKGVLAHGFRWDELPSVGYPIYILCLIVLFSLSYIVDLWNRQFTLTPVSLGLLILPALILAIDTARRGKQLSVLPGLFVLYLIYGFARACSVLTLRAHQRA